MAASDPTMAVATPKGALQGVAAASWDGSAWQPAGRTGPSVATPTGVLQGVAPFTWDGAAWQPSGRAASGVATPTGVLDGVAVYTWSGSAWTPAGGTATPSTPSGALRGVAAFSWDSSAWQPAAQAGPSVATPYGVLQGVAMFNWTGSAWSPGSALPAGATLDLSFLTPGTLDPRITFTRASTATYFGSTGTLQTAATNAPRWDYDPVTRALNGLLIEEARTNSVLNSATLVTQSVTVTAVPWTLSFYGTGTVTKTGAATGALVGTGAAQRVSQTFTPTAGTLTLTVTGSVLNAQLEAGAFSTSPIVTTAASVTRAADQCSIPSGQMGFFVAPGGSWFVEFVSFLPAPSNSRIIGLNNTSGGTTTAFLASSRIGGQYDNSVALQSANATTVNAVTKIASTWAVGSAQICVNGGAVASSASLTLGYATFATLGVGFMLIPGAGATDNTSGYLRRVRYWPRALSAAELQAVTT